MDKRLDQIKQWLGQDLSLQVDSLLPASEDASFRRYFRLESSSRTYSDAGSFIVMDAPPKQESIHEFIDIANVLAANGIHAPTVYASHIEHGFILLEDLGNRTYLQELQGATDNLYDNAIKALIKIQGINRDLNGGFSLEGVDNDYQPPRYDDSLVEKELNLFIDWYCTEHKKKSLAKQDKPIWTQLKQQLCATFAEQPQVWVHRDFHSRNLMITDKNSPGVIDFQDMVWGPISYDLASLFKDCYVAWPRTRQIKWLQSFVSQKGLSDQQFNNGQLTRWYDLTGMQRHLKVLGIFSRLNYRDNKSHYLSDLPLVEKYIHEVLTIYPEFDEFRKLFIRLSQ